MCVIVSGYGHFTRVHILNHQTRTHGIHLATTATYTLILFQDVFPGCALILRPILLSQHSLSVVFEDTSQYEAGDERYFPFCRILYISVINR